MVSQSRFQLHTAAFGLVLFGVDGTLSRICFVVGADLFFSDPAVRFGFTDVVFVGVIPDPELWPSTLRDRFLVLLRVGWLPLTRTGV